MHYRSGTGGFYQSTPTSRPFTAPSSPICPIKSCSPPRFLHRRHGWRNPLPQLHPRLHDGRRGQQAPGSPSRARFPSCGRHYCCAACSGAPLHPPEARPARKVLKDQQRAPEEEDDDEPEPPPGGRGTSGAAHPQTRGGRVRHRRNPRCDASCLRGTRRPRVASTSSG